MTKPQNAVEQIKNDAEDLFLGDDVNLDTRGLPIGAADLALVDLRDPFVPDEKFAPIDDRSRGYGSVALKRGIEALAEHDAETQQVLREHGVEDEHRPRQFNTPGWSGEMRFERGAWHFRVESEDGEQKQFKISVVDSETAQSQAARYLNKNSVRVRALAKDQELYVIRLAQMGKLEDAVNNYMAYSVPDYDGRNGGIITVDPRYQKLCSDCSWFIFKHSTPSFLDSPEVREFMTRFVGDRPTNVELLRFAFSAWNEAQKKEERGLILSQIETPQNEEITYEQLDQLSTEEISRLREQTLRDRAKKVRGGILQ
jgi:hypothetical protein